MIGDKEVGELWRAATKVKPPSPGFAFMNRAIERLIRKLVEERADYLCLRSDDFGGNVRYYVPDALNDFGIDPATFKEQP